MAGKILEDATYKASHLDKNGLTLNRFCLIGSPI